MKKNAIGMTNMSSQSFCCYLMINPGLLFVHNCNQHESLFYHLCYSQEFNNKLKDKNIIKVCRTKLSQCKSSIVKSVNYKAIQN